MKYTRKELLSIPKRKWNETLADVVGVYVIPSGKKHDSGFACMDFVAEFEDIAKPLVRFGGGCDDIGLEGTYFRVDCVYPSRILHIWNTKGFSVSSDLSTIYFRENDIKRKD